MQVTIRQIFQDVDLRGGMKSLSKLTKSKRSNIANLGRHEVYLCMNKKRDMIKVIGYRGMFVERLPAGETFDFTLRRTQILATIGAYFGVQFDIPQNVYTGARRQAGITSVPNVRVVRRQASA